MKTYSQIFFSETVRGMKLKVGIHANNVSLNIVYVLLSLSNVFCCYNNLKFHRLKMEIVEIRTSILLALFYKVSGYALYTHLAHFLFY